MLNKEHVISILNQAHKDMLETLSELSPTQKTKIKVMDNWTIKDIIAHLSAWYWECTGEIDRILQDKATWHRLYASEEGENKFNETEVPKRRNKTWEEQLNEFEESFKMLVTRVKGLSQEEWEHTSDNDKWGIGDAMAVYSLFDYEYFGKSHTAGHAKQIREFFVETRGIRATYSLLTA